VTRFRLTPLAESDLEEIVDFIVDASGPQRASAVLAALLAAAERVAERPGMGHVRPDLSDADVLFWPVYRYLIVYRTDAVPLEIVRVLHGSRDPAALREELRE